MKLNSITSCGVPSSSEESMHNEKQVITHININAYLGESYFCSRRPQALFVLHLTIFLYFMDQLRQSVWTTKSWHIRRVPTLK